MPSICEVCDRQKDNHWNEHCYRPLLFDIYGLWMSTGQPLAFQLCYSATLAQLGVIKLFTTDPVVAGQCLQKAFSTEHASQHVDCMQPKMSMMHA